MGIKIKVKGSESVDEVKTANGNVPLGKALELGLKNDLVKFLKGLNNAK